MNTREDRPNPTRTDHEIELTCIQPCIHSAAASDSGDQQDSIEVEVFLKKLVEVAFAIVSRHSESNNEERMK